jgi:uncharacterized protein YcbX
VYFLLKKARLKIAELWRYPVKSMAGEMVKSAHLDFSGMSGDRVVHIEDGHHRTITGRTHLHHNQQYRQVCRASSDFINQRVTNWTANDRQVRISLPVGVSYDSDPKGCSRSSAHGRQGPS